jgi:hypothetical protein
MMMMGCSTCSVTSDIGLTLSLSSYLFLPLSLFLSLRVRLSRFSGTTLFCRSLICRVSKCRNLTSRHQNVETLRYYLTNLGYHLTASINPKGGCQNRVKKWPISAFFRHFGILHLVIRHKNAAPRFSLYPFLFSTCIPSVTCPPMFLKVPSLFCCL